MNPQERVVARALDDLEVAIWALEGMEGLGLASCHQSGEVKVDHVVNLLYIVRTTIEARAQALRAAIQALPQQ